MVTTGGQAQIVQALPHVAAQGRRRGDKDSELLAVTPDLIREDENAGVAAEGRPGRDMIEAVKDGVARWLQVEDINTQAEAQAQIVQALSHVAAHARSGRVSAHSRRGAMRQAADEGCRLRRQTRIVQSRWCQGPSVM